MHDDEQSPLRVLTIFAHPDDAEFMCGGSAALWADQGAEITYVVVTNGAAGSNEPDTSLDELIRTREAEQRAACAVLGVQDVRFLGYPDGMLEPTMALRRDFTRIIRQVKPHRIIISDPGTYIHGDRFVNHPDHRAAAEAALYAIYPSAVTRPIFPELLAEGLEPHQVREIYMTSDEEHVNTRVDISATIDRKVEALLCHKSQLSPEVKPWIYDWAKRIGEPEGMAYAEAYRVIKLVREEEEKDADAETTDVEEVIATE